jgi:hypothetical protein
VTLALAAAACAALPPAPSQAQSLEAAVKANYLYKFGPFVEWPPRAFASPASPFEVCVLGRDPFGSALDQAVQGQTVEGRAIRVRRLAAVSAANGCQVVYIGASSDQTASEMVRALRGAPVLTVSDKGAASEAIVQFVVRDGRVRFALNLTAARANGLVISSKLQRLAIAINGRGG